MGKEWRRREGGIDIGDYCCRWEWKTREREGCNRRRAGSSATVAMAGLALLSHCNFLVSHVRRNYHGIATMLLPSSLQESMVDPKGESGFLLFLRTLLDVLMLFAFFDLEEFRDQTIPIAAHPLKPLQFAIGLTNGAVYVIEH
ncbi:hypothetical protein PIB30_078637 [Stylosanthes scabra]|uniref:Uncharacterized protein n=1 Tax=Stylosanthes scabra TaxID=79078 RepID=A0ABU6WQL7_9FABA|nr:hypothetical protein [Stylosanthes scabra]